MSKQKWINYIREYGQKNGDTEAAHSEADHALVAFLLEEGHQDLVEEYSKVKKWYA